MDIEFLRKKGALEIPSPNFCNQLLRSYVLWVHPFVPIIDLNQLLYAITADDGIYQISLPLFHAIMFAGSAYVKPQYLTAAGYASRKDARKAFFQRARLLYDMDAEDNRFSLVQALILMSYWFETPDGQKDTWHWARLAFSSACALQYDVEPEGTEALNRREHCVDPQRQQHWRIIFWSAYCRYIITALGMRQPMKEANIELDVPLLSPDDFSLDPLSPSLLATIGEDCWFLGNVQYNEQVVALCIAQTGLCIHLGRIMECQYSDIGSRIGTTTEKTITLAPATSTAEIVSRNDGILTSWLSELPNNIRYHPESVVEGPSQALFVHRAFLKMLYLTALVTLHRSHAASDAVQNFSSQKLSYFKMEGAANEITDIAYSLQSQDLTQFLPLTAVTAILAAAMFNLQRTLSTDDNVRLASAARLFSCTLVMQSLQSVHYAADFGLSMLSSTIRKAGFQWYHQYLCAIGSTITELL
ncbi:transcription factor [Hyphodiscus hymeniophilus]|uniref:Transcription factor n=1 Tax=Hyphodiscus hymeniophilus TaxID=353542 RepID=A0A9P6VDA0_9HELO|nr:transcription factor [Hyphodiscus hymeniophilus]